MRNDGSVFSIELFNFRSFIARLISSRLVMGMSFPRYFRVLIGLSESAAMWEWEWFRYNRALFCEVSQFCFSVGKRVASCASVSAVGQQLLMVVLGILPFNADLSYSIGCGLSMLVCSHEFPLSQLPLVNWLCIMLLRFSISVSTVPVGGDGERYVHFFGTGCLSDASGRSSFSIFVAWVGFGWMLWGELVRLYRGGGVLDFLAFCCVLYRVMMSS